ncbi:MAG: hypothetical protein H6R06_1199 [Proteobacteria bacterium]|jgi:hypothetical protein|nr:hypothetical protein [Pseudomonadota bacterium]
MDPQLRLQLANRIHLALMHELGQGIDVMQMLGNSLYARDVLLVCQAYPATELRRLGEQFRQATAELIERRAAQPAVLGRDSSDFGVSRPPAWTPCSSFDDFVDSLPDMRQLARRWLAPSTWFAR